MIKNEGGLRNWEQFWLTPAGTQGSQSYSLKELSFASEKNELKKDWEFQIGALGAQPSAH